MNLKHLLPGALAFAIAAILCPGARAADAAAQDQPSGNDQESTTLQRVEVRGRNQDDTRPKLQHIMKEVDGPLITVTKKTSITKIDNIPTVVDNNLRDLFAQTPGLYYSEQQSPGQVNLSYRGIGNPAGIRVRQLCCRTAFRSKATGSDFRRCMSSRCRRPLRKSSSSAAAARCCTGRSRLPSST